MAERDQHDFRAAELDPHLLSTPFKVQTNWHVITGSPSCGKTTLVNLLKRQGFETVPEAARKFMQSEIDHGQSIEAIHDHGAELQIQVKDLQLGIECGLRPSRRIFLDGGMPSSLAWYRAFGLDPNALLPDCFFFRYASVFILDPLPLELDSLRFKDTALSSFLNSWFDRDYNALGYQVVRVPAISPEERFKFVLEHVTKKV